ncbi:MAG: CocE/NonD family hydrolase [Steroidobacter sp.]|nr:CocE/NonD family hydrolase [Steroidobacter sp.]
MLNRTKRVWTVLACVAFSSVWAQSNSQGNSQSAPQSASSEQGITERVMVPMRDGIRLSTDILRPAQPGNYPVILMRDPYGGGVPAEAKDWVAHGYVFVSQQVRGRGKSEGAFYPYINEITDGYDTQQWLGSQPWSNGKVGMKGGSYLASAQWLSAHLRAPALVAIAPTVTPFNYHQDVMYTGGALSFASRMAWGFSMGGANIDDATWDKMLMHLPLKTMDKTFGFSVPHWRDWLAHPSYDAYWKMFDVESRVSQIDVPSLNIGGWYDTFLHGTLTSYQGMRDHGYSEKARRGQKLVIGPWEHFRRSEIGELQFGPDARIDFEALHRRWFDHWLKGQDTGFMQEAPVRIFVMGTNRWRDEQEWPLARAQNTKYYLHNGGQLSPSKPAAVSKSDTYIYDPANPVPTRGGSLMARGLTAGPLEQGNLGERDDVLVFSTPKLSKDTEVTGPITVTLYATSSAPDTDFTAKLIDVHPDGKAYNLVDGIIRARYRESFENPSLIEPGKVYAYSIDLWATSNVFKKGHRIRLDISSSNFPRFDRNPNTGHAFGEDAELRKATQTIHHSQLYPSHITLPLIP